MRKPPPQPRTYLGFTAAKWVIVAEAAVVIYAYSVYHRLNKYQDYRYKYHKEHPWILDKYYQVGELLGGYETRKTDLDHWNKLQSVKETSS